MAVSPSLQRVLPARPFLEAVQRAASLGVGQEELLAALRLTPDALSAPSGHITSTTFDAFWRELPRLTGDELFGLHLAERYQLPAAGPLHYLFQSCRTLRDKYQRISQCIGLLDPWHEIRLVEEKSRAFVRCVPRDPSAPMEPQLAECVVAMLARTGRAYMAVDWQPEAIHLAHTPPRCDEHERILSAPVRVDQLHNQLVIPSAALDLPLVGFDPYLNGLMQGEVERLTQALPHKSPAAGRLRALLLELLPEGDIEAHDAAVRLKISLRTLQRMLKDEGTSFREQLDVVRRECALELVARTRLPITDITFRCGFSEIPSFFRAFRRWTGMTPRDYRKLMQGTAEGG